MKGIIQVFCKIKLTILLKNIQNFYKPKKAAAKNFSTKEWNYFNDLKLIFTPPSS